MSPRGTATITVAHTELTDDQRAAVRAFCALDVNDGIYEPAPERRWLFAYALAALVNETDAPTVEEASAFYDDATVEEETRDAGDPPWTLTMLPRSGNYDAVVIINDRIFGAEVGEGYTELSIITDATVWLADVRRTAAVAALRDMAIRIRRGPAMIPMRPSIIAALVDERADDLEAGR